MKDPVIQITAMVIGTIITATIFFFVTRYWETKYQPCDCQQ